MIQDNKQLLAYYERELRFIRESVWEFAEKYPEPASALLLERSKCEDPHVERIIEAFSILTARIQMRLDDGFPQIGDAVLDRLFPHYQAPMPAMTIAQFFLEVDAESVSGGTKLSRGLLLHSQPINDTRCRFRTSYDIDLFPLSVEQAELIPIDPGRLGAPPEARAAYRIRLRTTNGDPVSSLDLHELRFYLGADTSLGYRVYENVFKHPIGAIVQTEGSPPQFLGSDSVIPGGFNQNESLIADSLPEAHGYRLLQEFFCFPQKFLFLSVAGLEKATLGDSEEVDILILLAETDLTRDGQIGPRQFRLGCTPCINLFPKTADPIQLDGTEFEHLVQPDGRARTQYDVHSIQRVVHTVPGSPEEHEYLPFYGLHHGSEESEARFWVTSRRESNLKGVEGTDVWLTFIDRQGLPQDSETFKVLHIETLATNGNLPTKLPIGLPGGDLTIEAQPDIEKVIFVMTPTPTLRPPLTQKSRWQLVSCMNMNFLTFSGSAASSEQSKSPAPIALHNLLALHDFSGSAANQQRREGLVGIETCKVTRSIPGVGPVRGIRIDVTLKPENYVGSSPVLFVSVLERFLALHATLNSFIEVVARFEHAEGTLRRWAPRIGEKQRQ